MNFQCIYRKDVVIQKEHMIGIVVRVAGESDSDSNVRYEGGDKDENGDNNKDSGFEMNNVDVDFGNTNFNENEDDGNTFYDCSDDECIPLPSDHVRVAWLDRSEATLKSSDVTVTDRRFLRGDFVTLVSEPTRQIGVVVDVHLCVDIESSDGFSLKGVSSKDLKRVREFAIGDYVVLGTWLGRVDDVLDNVTVLFDDGSVCKVIEADPSQLKPVGSNAVMDVCFPYYPGQQVQATSSIVFMSSKWLSGSWKTGKLEGTVINVKAASLSISWLSTSGCAPDSLTAPAEEQSPNKICKALSCFSHTNWQLGDRCFLPDFYLRSGLSKAEINVSLNNGEDCGQNRNGSFADADSGKTDVSSEVDMADMDQECSNCVESKPSNDFLSNSKEALSQTWSIHRKKMQRSVVRRDKKMPGREESYECALLIRNTKTTIDVLWQDGKLECSIEAVGLIPLENPGDHDFVPEQYVMDRGSDENGDDGELRRTGVVRSVNALERTAIVRWLNPCSSNENGQVFEGEEVVSVYELEGHPDYDYCYGDVVVRLSHSTASSAETSLIKNSSDDSKLKDDFSDAKHHINHIKNNQFGLETSMESILSRIGNITNLKDGFIEVTWADGIVSTVCPQAVFVVGRDEDESISDGSNNDDTDSQETVNSDETTVSVKPEVPLDYSKVNGSHLLVNDNKKYKAMLVRTYSTVWMIGGFILVIYMGHLYIWAMIVIIQIFMAKELFNLLRKAREDWHLPGFRLLNWYFFFTAMLFVYGRILSQRLVNTVTSDKFLNHLVGSLVKYHMVSCYFLYIAGFMWFILTLKKKLCKYQFGQYAWTHMILIVVFAQSAFTVANIFEGIFWFLLPASLIVINDIAAYLFGFFIGRTPLIKLSPKKTWEGFIGASFATIFSAFVLANVMGRFKWLTCPRKDLTTGWLNCDTDPLFVPEIYSVIWVPQWFPWKEVVVLPVQWHALYLGLFASIIAPFGGFFASGFKRAFNIKDFGDSIPGHGGITDRMDCQMVMAVFAYIYHQSFVISQGFSVEMILEQIFMHLSFEEQRAVYVKLGQVFRERQRLLSRQWNQ